MRFVERSYAGDGTFRPKPVIQKIESPFTLVIATPWGPRESADQAAQLILHATSESKVDDDITRMGPIEPEAVDPLEQLLTAVQKANETLLTTFNASEFVTLVEVTALTIQNNFLYWVHIGNPHVFLRTDVGAEPLAYRPDPSFLQWQTAPLAQEGLGWTPRLLPQSGSFPLGSDFQLLLASTTFVPPSFYQRTRFDLEELGNFFSKSLSPSAFWLGLLESD